MRESRTIRIFLSSTFRDFGEERDLLVKRVFPALRARLKDRFIELVDVDLRWGITAEDAERGEVLPICLAEIDRARPYFIGMLGERYGWVPPPDGYANDLLDRQPWLKRHQGGKSVTELEILHGVLNKRSMRGRCFFYFRSPNYARTKGGDYLPSPEDRKRQSELKRRIRERGLPVTPYAKPEALAKHIERDLWKLLDEEFPASEVPDAFERERLRHEAYANPRRRLYLGGERYLAVLQKLLDGEESRIVVEGASGCGKSSLLANFVEAYQKRHPRHLLHQHYLGASADAADPHALVRRLIEFIQRAIGSTEEIPGDPQRLMDSLPVWLASASSWARKRKVRFIFVIDSINSLTAQKDLRWWPAFLPKGITMLVSCLSGPVLDKLKGDTDVLVGQGKLPKWRTVTVRGLTKAQSANLMNTYLGRFNKKLPAPMVRQVQEHPLATTPLFLRTLAEELRLFGVHEELQKRLDDYLTSQTVEDLFERVLQRVEKDAGKKRVKAAMTAIWASRAGLTEKEILGIAELTPASWASIRYALNEALVENSGKLLFAHDYLRSSIRSRYLSTPQRQSNTHAVVGRWFRSQPFDVRRVQEEPWQWLMAKRWSDLTQWLDDRKVLCLLTSEAKRREWLSYWLNVSDVRQVDLSSHYSRVWSELLRGLDKIESLTLIFAMQQALATAGYLDDFVERLARTAILLSRDIFGELHVKTCSGYRNLADLLAMRRNVGDSHEAILLLQDVVSIERESGSHELATTLNLLGTLLASEQRFDEARLVYEEALVLFRAIDGNENPDSTATILNNLGDLENARGSPDKAHEWLVQCLQIRKRTLPPDHPLLAVAMDNLAKALAARRRMSEASAFFERALTMRVRVLGNDHPETNNTRVNWGTYLFHNKQFDKAGELFNKAWQADALRFGPEHYYAVMDAVTCLACKREESVLFSQSGQHKKALQLLDEAYVSACVLTKNAKNSNEEAKEAVIRAIKKLSTQASTFDAISFVSMFDSLADSLLDRTIKSTT
jgi:tetratricopeptide (TPR) repeat protein